MGRESTKALTLDGLFGLWQKAVAEFERKYPVRQNYPHGLKPYDPKCNVYVNTKIVKIFRDLLLEAGGERGRGKLEINRVFDADELKVLRDALNFYKRYNGREAELSGLIEKIDKVRKYLKAEARMEKLEEELK